LRPVFESAIERGVLHGMVFAGLWKDVGTPERLIEARETVQQRA
jgi:NDP-sugar pyrophosphorylase family protein